MTTATVRLLVGALLLLLAAPAQPAAEESAADRQGAPRPEVEAERPPAGPPASKPAGDRRSPDTFVPSEKVSEDLPVSFPVDI